VDAQPLLQLHTLCTPEEGTLFAKHCYPCAFRSHSSGFIKNCHCTTTPPPRGRRWRYKCSAGMAPFIPYFEAEFPSIYHLEMHDWNAALAIPEPEHSMASASYFRFWAQAIAAGHLRDATTADKATAAASQLEDATQKDGGPVGAEIAVTRGTIKAWQSFAHSGTSRPFNRSAPLPIYRPRSVRRRSRFPPGRCMPTCSLLTIVPPKPLCSIAPL
jgi:hypothetical protein